MTEWSELQTMFLSEDDEERVEALRRLPDGDTKAALSMLLQALGDFSWRVRKQAVELYLSRGDADESADKIIALLYSSDNAGLRNAAVEILIRLGSVVTQRLIDETASDDHDVRKFAIDILGGIVDPACVPALMKALDDPDENVRAAAAENLGKIGSEEAVPALLAAMKDADLLSRFTILEAIGRVGRPVAIDELLPYRDDQLLRKPLYECLGKVGDISALSTLSEGIIAGPANLSESAIYSLQQLVERCAVALDDCFSAAESRQLADSLCRFFGHEKQAIRRAAVSLFGQLRDSDNAERLLDLLAEEDLQDTAFKALVALGGQGAERLANIWPQVDATQKTYIAYLFGEVAYKKGLLLLHEALLADDPQLREVAAGALGKVGDSGSLQQLTQLFTDAVDSVKNAAVNAVVRLGGADNKRALEEVCSYLHHEVAETRMAAVAALGGLGGPDASGVLKEALKDVSPHVRQAAVRVLTPSAGESTIDALSLALMDEDAGVRRLAVEKMGMCGDSAVLAPLELALADEDIWVRSAAVRALGRIGGEAQLPRIETLLSDPVGLVSIAVLDTVAEIDPKRSHALYSQALEHQDPEVVISALQGLARDRCTEIVVERVALLAGHRSVEVRAALYRTLAELLENQQALPILQSCLEGEQDDLTIEQLQEQIDLLAAARG